MYRKKRSKCIKLNNSGSAIVTVIVLVAFVSILATTILYVSGMNYYMKMTDLRTKESFYRAETALEEIKAALVSEVAVASEEAYLDVQINYAATDGFTRYSLFQDKFFEILDKNWEDKRVPPSGGDPLPYLEIIKPIVDDIYKPGLELDASIVNAGSMELHEAEGYALLRGVVLTYTENGYTTMITTDYVITVPEVNWGVDESKTSWAAGDDSSSLERDSIDMAEYVKYYNWAKK